MLCGDDVCVFRNYSFAVAFTAIMSTEKTVRSLRFETRDVQMHVRYILYTSHVEFIDNIKSIIERTNHLERNRYLFYMLGLSSQ